MKKSGIAILSMVTGAAAAAGTMGKIQSNKLAKEQKMSDKHLALFLMMNQWVKVKQKGKKLSSYFEERGYTKIAVYGMSYAGETLVDELKNTKVEVAYGIDKRSNSLYADIDIISMEDVMQPVDAVVVTAITFFDEIEEMLSDKLQCPVISLEDILYEV